MNLFKRTKQKTVSDLAKTTIVKTVGQVKPVNQSPDEAYGELFSDVQENGVYSDGKTFVDLVPKKRAIELRRAYAKAVQQPGFDLHEFVNENFYEYSPHKAGSHYVPDGTLPARQHVTELWSELERRNRRDRGSLLSLPYPYIVPGGRFEEQFYWDSYFIMLGLAADKRWLMIEGMMKNYAYMLRKFGCIPTANRTYFLSRSQPPFFVYMVELLASERGRPQVLAEYLPYLLLEYRFWMKGRRVVQACTEYSAYKRVVEMPNGALLNRYYDDKRTPRPESRREDMEAAAKTHGDEEALFVHLRAGAESGWDFSSRWFDGDKGIEATRTTNLVAVDLNCLLYTLERTIAETYTIIRQPVLAGRFLSAAKRRLKAIQEYCWNDDLGFFTDYDFKKGEPSRELTLAGAYALYAHVATPEQAALMAQQIERQFLKAGGLVTTLKSTNQQWDAPNGWAPLQWVTIQGLRDYGYDELARTIRDRWIAANETVYDSKNKMVEKYDVEQPGVVGGGGEYPLQDGFGWTNGVYAALKDEQIEERKQKENA